MNIKETMVALLDGKKIGSKTWPGYYYIYFDDKGTLVNQYLISCDLNTNLEYNIFEEPKAKLYYWEEFVVSEKRWKIVRGRRFSENEASKDWRKLESLGFIEEY